MIFLTLFSCQLQNKIVLEDIGKGTMALSLELPSYMLDSIDIVAASIPGGEDLLKPENIEKKLLRSKDIRKAKVLSPRRGAYDIRFQFENFAGGKNDFFQWSQKPNGDTELAIVVNRKTYQELEQRFPSMRDNTLLQLYGPATTGSMNRSDYLDMVEYSFGSEARSDLSGAEAMISVQVPGQIVLQTGGVKKNSNTVEFRLRLLNLALLTQEERYSVVYR